MKILAHLLKADRRRFRVPIAVWILVTIVTAAAEGMAPFAAEDRRSLGLLGLVFSTLWLTRLLVASVIVALIVQSDSVVGSTAFWMTRPIDPRTLLGSKLTLVSILLLGVPALCDLALMTSYRVPIATMTRVVLGSSLQWAVVAIVLMCGAALTRDVARFALLWALLAVSVTMAVSAGALLNPWRAEIPFVAPPPESVAISDGTGTLAGIVLTAAAGVLLLFAQYRTRSRKRSVAVGAVGAALAIVVALAWPWPLLQARQAPPAWAASGERPRLESFPQPVVFDSAGASVLPVRFRTARAVVFLAGVPDGWIATSRLLNGSLRMDDGRTLQGVGGGYLQALPPRPNAEPLRTEALRHVLGVSAIGLRGRFDYQAATILTLPHYAVPSDRVAAVYDGEFAVELQRLEIAGVLPLRAGETFQEGSFRLVIGQVRGPFAASGGATIRTRISHAASLFDRRRRTSYAYFVRNRTTSEAIEGQTRFAWERRHNPFEFFAAPVRSVGFFARAEWIYFPHTVALRVPPAVAPEMERYTWVDDKWIEQAELVIIRATRVDEVVRSLQIRVSLNES